MANFEIDGFRDWLQTISEKTASAAADEIVTDLKTEGPYYTGEFEEAWRVLPEDTPVTPNKPSSLTTRERWQAFEDGSLPFNRRITDTEVPQGYSTLTIGNEMQYRAIAMDLMPGRTPKDGNTAPQDWFVRYLQGTGLSAAVARGIARAARDAAVKNFKGK